jgi:hypothetical protein
MTTERAPEKSLEHEPRRLPSREMERERVDRYRFARDICRAEFRGFWGYGSPRWVRVMR